MQRTLVWAILAVGGLGLMFYSYKQSAPPATSAASQRQLLFVGYGLAPARGLPRTPLALRARVLPGWLTQMPNASPSAELAVSDLLLDVPELAKSVPADYLASGRWPNPGSYEVVAGAMTGDHSTLVVDGRSLSVVGVLQPSAASLGRCYLLDANGTDDLFPASGKKIRDAYLMPVPPEGVGGNEVKEIQKAFSAAHFTEVLSFTPVGRSLYYLYLLGMALLLAAGSALFIRFYRAAAARKLPAILRGAFGELALRRRLLVGVHVAYFGATMAMAAAAYEMPNVQRLLLGTLQGQLASDSGNPLAGVAKAYLSHNILAAAGVTFAVNLVLASVLVITLPSMILPGCGALAALFRALTWGLLLGPTSVELAKMMLPHSLTLLVEGEGYILAAFFGLLIPIHLFDKRYGPGIFRRFGRALAVNAAGIIVTAGVLAVAAVYEATEVILMMRGM